MKFMTKKSCAYSAMHCLNYGHKSKFFPERLASTVQWLQLLKLSIRRNYSCSKKAESIKSSQSLGTRCSLPIELNLRLSRGIFIYSITQCRGFMEMVEVGMSGIWCRHNVIQDDQHIIITTAGIILTFHISLMPFSSTLRVSDRWKTVLCIKFIRRQIIHT